MHCALQCAGASEAQFCEMTLWSPGHLYGFFIVSRHAAGHCSSETPATVFSEVTVIKVTLLGDCPVVTVMARLQRLNVY